MSNTLRARELRKNLTDAERFLWKHIRLRQVSGHKFRRQQPIDQFIVDFVCLERRLVIEVDGGHHQQQGEQDAARTAYLEANGFRVLRFWNNEVLQQIEGVLYVIAAALEPPP